MNSDTSVEDQGPDVQILTVHEKASKVEEGTNILLPAWDPGPSSSTIRLDAGPLAYPFIASAGGSKCARDECAETSAHQL